MVNNFIFKPRPSIYTCHPLSFSHLQLTPCREGAYPPADSARATDCKYKSFVVLSDQFNPPQFGRASLNEYCDGLQAWFPYGGDEHHKEDFLVLRSGDCQKFYWARVRQVHKKPNAYELVKHGQQSPAVMAGILGKAHVAELQGWISNDGEEKGVSQEEVLDGLVLCIKDRDCSEHAH